MTVLQDHDRLDAYQLARELARTGNTIMQHVPPGRADLIDQFRRACLSVQLNTAEGAGEFAPREKARFYRIAKRSATESSAILDHMVDLGILHEAETFATRKLLSRITGTLVRLILSTENRARYAAAPAPSPARTPERARASDPFP